MKHTVPVFAISLVCLMAACREKPRHPPQVSEPMTNAGISGKLTAGNKVMAGKVFLARESFLRLTNGFSFNKAMVLLGTQGDHQFTVRRGGDQYRFTTFWIDIGEGLSQWVVCSNNIIISFPKGIPLSRKSPSIEDESMVNAVLAAPSMTAESMASELDEAAASYLRSKRSEDPLPAFVIEPLLDKRVISRIRQDYERNAELLKLYNGHRVVLGMTAEQVDKLFGVPMRIHELANHKSARIYGTNVPFTLSFYTFSWVAVVFEDGQASRVYSNGFFHRSWK